MRLPFARVMAMVSFVALVHPHFGHAAITLTRAQAVNAVVSELGLSDQLAWCPKVDYGFGSDFEGILPAGTTVRPVYLNTAPYPGNTVTLTNPMYLFYVDDYPNAGFTHRVRYVYVDATVGNPTLAAETVVVQEQGWWPLIQRPSQPEEELFPSSSAISGSIGSPTNPDGLVFGDSNPPPVPALPDWEILSTPPVVTATTANNCAIIMTGVAEGALGTYEGAVNRSADSLRANLERRGVPSGRIQTQRNGNKKTLRSMIAAACNTMPPCDKIYVYIGTHGNVGSLLLGADGNVSADTLCAIIKELGGKNVPVCMMIEACYSGSLVPALRGKLPLGVIVTAASKDSVCWGDNITGKGNHGFFSWAFFNCWNAAAADSNGDGTVDWAEAFKWVCAPGNGNVPWGGSNWDVKTRGPTLTGLPTKTHRWQGPVSGAWYTDIWRDTDHDGAYDQCDWVRDDDCDGIADVIYLNDDKDEDGKRERTVCIRDANDDGTPESRYDFNDPNDDGNTDTIVCYTRVGMDWVETVTAPRRSTNQFMINPPFGSSQGGQPFQIQPTGPIQWFNPNLDVFVGSESQNVQLFSPVDVRGMTWGYFPGATDVIVADFNLSSPSFGFDELQDGFQYTPEIFVASVEPDHGACDLPHSVQIKGGFFDVAAQVKANGIPIPSLWIDANTMHALIPPMPCGSLVDVTVANAADSTLVFLGPGGEATLEDAFAFVPGPDQTAPSITCPGPVKLATGNDALARTDPGYGATGSDETALYAITRNDLGALSPGMHTIDFEAIDAAGNRTVCSATVDVNLASGIDDKPVTIGFAFAGAFPNPYPGNGIVRFSLPREDRVRIVVYSAAGRRVATVVDGVWAAGEYEVPWRAVDDRGQGLANGIYFMNMESGSFESTRRVTVIR